MVTILMIQGKKSTLAPVHYPSGGQQAVVFRCTAWNFSCASTPFILLITVFSG
jgi:hypothetical protein